MANSLGVGEHFLIALFLRAPHRGRGGLAGRLRISISLVSERMHDKHTPIEVRRLSSTQRGQLTRSRKSLA